MSWATVATVAQIAVAATSLASVVYAAAQGTPKSPNLASASREVAEAQAAALPTQRALAAAEAQGGTGTVTIPKGKVAQQFVHIPTDEGWAHPGGFDPTSPFFGDSKSTKSVPYDPKDWQEGGKYYQKFGSKYDPTKHIYTKKVTVGAHDQTYDFSGYGTADIQGKLAKQMADIEKNLGAKYGTQYAEEAAKEAALADPEGTAARKAEYQMIEDQINNAPPVNPLAPELEKQIKGQLNAGSGLDDVSRSLLDRAVEEANAARGGRTASGDIAESMSTGAEGESRRESGIGKAQQFLSSGSTPEDIAYRREQQNISNLGAFVNQQTPESQFHDLSGVGQGATPFYPGQAPPTQPNNAGTVGPAYSVGAYQQQLHNAGGQANGWMAGLSSLLNGVSSIGKTLPTG